MATQPSSGSPPTSPPTKPALPAAARTRRDSTASPTTTALEKPQETEENVHVICRVRPFNPREIELHRQSVEGKPEWDQYPIRSVVDFSGQTCVFLDHEKDWMEKERFQFDSCLWSIPDEVQKCDNPFAGQATLFDEFGEKVLTQAWKGYNTCFFAYGQTGSGKTYSMMGADMENPGLTPRICQKLFDQVIERQREADSHREQHIAAYRVEMRYLEIYNEMAKDLLWSLSPLTAEAKAKINPENLRVRSSPATGVFVENITAIEVDNWQRMSDLIELGNQSRHTAATKMNERSSRSHAIFKITLSQVTTTIPKKQFEKPTECIRESTINLVDLAGSERNKKTGATGDRLKEAASINKSLLCLKQVIDALVDNCLTKGPKKRIPYRDSSLTSLLMDSLGGNSKTFMLVTISPHCDNAEETLQTLRYGSRARQIVNVVHVNENAASRMMVDLEDQLERMKQELEKASSPEAVEQLRAQIQEHEASIGHLNTEMEEQQERIEKLREMKDKEMKQRHAIAMINLHALTQARLRRDEAEDEQKRLRRKLSTLRHSKEDWEKRQESAEKEQDRLRDLIEEEKRQCAEVEHEVDQWKKKLRRLEAYKTELTKTVAEQEGEIKRVGSEKIATVLRGKLQAARLRLEHARRTKDQHQAHEAELKRLTQEHAVEEEKLIHEFVQRESTVDKEIQALETQLQTVQADLQKLETEKGGQITKLQEEVTQLKTEHQKKSDENNARIRQTQADWEKRYVAMVSDMDRQLQELTVQWDTKHKETINTEDSNYAKSSQQWKREVEETAQVWEEKRRSVEAEGEKRCKEAEDEWKKKLAIKEAENKQLRSRLQQVANSEAKYAGLHHRVGAFLDNPPPAGTSDAHSPEYLRLLELLKVYHAEYADNQPSNYKLQQLLRGEHCRARCDSAPTVGVESSNGSSGAHFRGASPSRSLRNLRSISPRK